MMTDRMQSPIVREKACLRTHMRALRKSMAAPTCESHSNAITAKLRSLPEVLAAQTVAAYMSVGNEVGTGAFIACCHEAGQRVCVPAFQPDGTYQFSLLAKHDALMVGPMQIPEPATPVQVAPADIDVVIVPGLAFDREGRRLGQGGGHYDRLLSEISAPAVGVAFAGAVVARVPVAPHDCRMALVVTELDIIRVADTVQKRE